MHIYIPTQSLLRFANKVPGIQLYTSSREGMQDNVVYTEDKIHGLYSKKPHTLTDIHVGSHRSGSIGKLQVKMCNRHLQRITFWGMILENEIRHADTKMYTISATVKTWF